MSGPEINIDGIPELNAALARKKAAIRRAMETAMSDIVSHGHRAMAELLRIYTHPLGTVTPSPPGHPPALVTGNLIRGIAEQSPSWTGNFTITAGFGPTAVYARIQDKGGQAGRNHAATLPPRPYVKPTVEITAEAAPRILRDALAAALRS